MPDNKQGSIHSSSEGGTVGNYPDPDPSEFLVAPATSGESNALRFNLFLAGYLCISDIRFKFDSSFVLPAVQTEMQAFSKLRNGDPQVKGSPISIFGHADPSFEGNFEPGSSTAQSGDDYNKTLSGRRAIAIYALLIRDPSFWEDLYSKHLGTDIWGVEAIQIMLDHLPPQAASPFGGSSQGSSSSAQSARAQDIANDSSQRRQLFVQYMNSLGGDLKLDKSADFLARNAGTDQKGDVQGCSRFNPLLVFNSEDQARFKTAFAKNDQPTLRGDRDIRNAVNRRVHILIFKKGTQVLPAKWPCPTYKEGVAGCKKRFFKKDSEGPDGDTRRSRHNSGADRKFELSHDTFACRFFQRISGDKSPCNSTAPVLTCTVTISPKPLFVCAACVGGGQKDIAAAVGTPAGGTFTWSSDDTGVAIVEGAGDKGTVSGAAAGVTKIHVIYSVGSSTSTASVDVTAVKVELVLKNTDKIVPAPENSTNAADKASAGGVDDLGPLPMGQGRGESPGLAYTSPLMVIGTVTPPAAKTLTLRWKRFITRRSWNIRHDAATKTWNVTQRSKRLNDDDTGGAQFNNPRPSPQSKIYIYDCSALQPGNRAQDAVGDFIYEEKDFTYRVERQLRGNFITCAEIHVGQIEKVKRKATTGTTVNDWTGLENSTAIRTVSATIDETKVRAIVGGTDAIVIDPAANN